MDREGGRTYGPAGGRTGGRTGGQENGQIGDGEMETLRNEWIREEEEEKKWSRRRRRTEKKSGKFKQTRKRILSTIVIKHRSEDIETENVHLFQHYNPRQ